MRAIILAAGRGSRMGHLTDNQPKCLTVLRGKPLIEHQIQVLSEAGVQDIGIVTGYKSEMLKNYGVRQFHNHRWSETNMVASLLCAREWLEQDDCIVSYADIFYSVQIVKDLMACADDIAIAYDLHWLELWSKRFENPLNDAETFRIDHNGYVTEIGQKPKTIAEIQGQYMGLLKFRRGKVTELVDLSNLNIFDLDMTSFLSCIVALAVPVKGCPNDEAWGEYDQPIDLKCYL